MVKLGKMFGPVVLIFALGTVWMGMTIFKETLRYRSQEAKLAMTIVETAKALGPDVKLGKDITYEAAQGKLGKEGGSIGYEAFKASEGEHGEVLKQLPELVGKVVAHRDALAQMLVKLAQAVQCPPAQQPNMAKLKSLDEYAKACDSVTRFIAARLNRDNKLRNQINAMFKSVGVSQQYSGKITANGDLEAADVAPFKEVAKKFANLNSANAKVLAILRSVATAIASSNVSGASWKMPADPSAYKLNGASDADLKKLDALAAAVNSNNNELKKQLARIASLTKELEEYKAQVVKLQSARSTLRDKEKKFDKMVTDFYARGLNVSNATPVDIETISMDKVDQMCTGVILTADEKTQTVVLNLAQDKVVVGLRLFVHRGDAVVGVIRIREVFEHNSLAIIEKGEVLPGDVVVIAISAIQTMPLK